MNIIEKQITAVLILVAIILLYIVGRDILKFLKRKLFFKFLSWRLRRMATSINDRETKDILHKASNLSNKISQEEKLYNDEE